VVDDDDGDDVDDAAIGMMKSIYLVSGNRPIPVAAPRVGLRPLGCWDRGFEASITKPFSFY
jgi:hypothetical protein